MVVLSGTADCEYFSCLHPAGCCVDALSGMYACCLNLYFAGVICQ